MFSRRPLSEEAEASIDRGGGRRGWLGSGWGIFEVFFFPFLLTAFRVHILDWVGLGRGIRFWRWAAAVVCVIGIVGWCAW